MATRKVNPSASKSDKPEKPKGRPKFTGGERNDAKKLTSSPVNVEDPEAEGSYNLSFAPLKKDAFVDEATYLDFRADVTELRIAKMRGTVENLREQAEIARKFGDSTIRKKAQKAARMREMLAKLEKELSDAGIESDD